MCFLPKCCVLFFSEIHGGTDKLECNQYHGCQKTNLVQIGFFNMLEHETINIASIENY